MSFKYILIAMLLLFIPGSMAIQTEISDIVRLYNIPASASSTSSTSITELLSITIPEGMTGNATLMIESHVGSGVSGDFRTRLNGVIVPGSYYVESETSKTGHSFNWYYGSLNAGDIISVHGSRLSGSGSIYVDSILLKYDVINPSMPLVFEVVGAGQFFAVKNGIEQGVASPGTPITVNYQIGDSIAFYTIPYEGNNLISVCDYPQTECQTLEYYSYTVTGQLPQKMIAVFSAYTPTPTPTVTTTPTPASTQSPVIPDPGIWSVSAYRTGDNLDVSACSGSTLGYFYMTTPSNQHKYATYIDPNQCSNFTLPVYDMTASEGEGIWTLSIFDNNDLLQSKAFFQIILENNIIISFNSNPSGANVFVNNIYECTTPCNKTISAGDLSVLFTKIGYNNNTITGHYTASGSINAILIPVSQNTTIPTPGQTYTPYIPDDATLNQLNSLENVLGLFSFVPPLIGLIISAILTGGTYIWVRWQDMDSDCAIIASVLMSLIAFILGLLPWYIFVIVVIIIVSVGINAISRQSGLFG